MATAIAAKTNDILIIEANPRLGKKLLATGNGKCNLLNLNLYPSCYNDADFVAPTFERYNIDNIKNFFVRLGLMLRFDDAGRGYPFSESANTVLDVLRQAISDKGVDVLCDTAVTRINNDRNGYCVYCNDGKTFFADKIVIATGSNAGFGTDSLNLVYDKVKTRSFRPSLAPLLTDTALIAGLNGVRVKCRASLITGGKTRAEEEGEILFRTFGVSGIAAYNLSAVYSRAGCPSDAYISLDFLGDERAAFVGKKYGVSAGEFLSGVFQKMLCNSILKYAGVRAETIVDKVVAEKLLNAATDFRLRLTGVSDMSLAQVATGGVCTGAVNKNTLEAEGKKNLYFTGEALDVDGLCGGYNLTWAWASAFVVAESLI